MEIRIKVFLLHRECPEINIPTQQLTLEVLKAIARLGANVRYLYLILNNVCQNPETCNTPKDQVQHETRRLVSYCKYARHRTT